MNCKTELASYTSMPKNLASLLHPPPSVAGNPGKMRLMGEVIDK